MDRWTERFNSDDAKAIAIHDGSDFPDVCFEGEKEYDAMNALADYEDLEEQGLLVRLPCKVGDTVYDIVGRPLKIVEHKVDAFHIDKKGFHLQIINGVLEKKQEAKVYFSLEEAEKKLKEMKK